MLFTKYLSGSFAFKSSLQILLLFFAVKCRKKYKDITNQECPLIKLNDNI